MRLFITTIIAALGLLLSTTAAGREGKIYIIDGYFFDEIPMDQYLMSGLVMLKASDGTRATGLVLKEPLPEAALRYALPADSVANAAELLGLYEARKGKPLPCELHRAELVRTGETFAPFTATDMEGRTWTEKDIAGQVAVFNLWFTGCGPCQAEMPLLSQWKAELPDAMYFSSTYEDADTARPVIESRGFSWTALVDNKDFGDLYGGNGYPVTIIVDRHGKVAQVEYGTSPLQRDSLRETIARLLGAE